MDRGSIEDWSNLEIGSQEIIMTVELEPAGSVLPRIFYTCELDHLSVSSLPYIIIISLYQ